MNRFSYLQAIAEVKIAEAIEKGELDNLPGAGKPLNLENMDNVPEELRMAYKILKNANCLPKELEERKEMASLATLLDSCEDEDSRKACLKKLRLLFLRQPRLASLHGNDEYLLHILSRMEEHERRSKKDEEDGDSKFLS